MKEFLGHEFVNKAFENHRKNIALNHKFQENHD